MVKLGKMEIVMEESKIVTTERLRREGRWEEASAYRDQVRKELRSQGKPRKEAAERAWDTMMAKFPPLAPPEPASEPAADSQDTQEDGYDLLEALCDTAWAEVEHWRQKHGLEIPSKALTNLAGEVVAYHWLMGLMGYVPGLDHRTLIRVALGDPGQITEC